MRVRWVAAFMLGGVIAAAAQQPAQPAGQPDQSNYTLHANARVVVTDVTVTDAKGNPIHRLPQSAFRIFDGGKPQLLQSFEEHAGGAEAVGAQTAAANTGSNAFLLHPPAVFNVIVLDTSTIEILDQMYLNQQLSRFIDTLPPGQPLAIYMHDGDVAIQLQSFTSDHAILLKALHKAIPRLKRSGASTLSDQDALKQMSIYLAQYPGRKNLLWFSGGSNLYLMADAAGGNGLQPDMMPVQQAVDMRATYDRLERARIAVYPIDVRGLTQQLDLMTQSQQMLMQEQAESTGGHAYFNNNGLTEIANKILNTDDSFYTLTYSPADFKVDDKWHKVKVEVEGGSYNLSYRRGYYGDESNLPDAPHEKKPFEANGESMQMPEDRTEPIIFQASLQTVAPGTKLPYASVDEPKAKRDEVTYAVHFLVPANVFSRTTVEKGERVNIGTGILAFNQYGRPVKRQAQEVKLTFNGDQLQTRPNGHLAFDQLINLPKGENYLYVLVWDLKSGRMGTVQVPVDVAKK